MRDLYNNLYPGVSFDPAAKTASVTGSGVDLQFFEGADVMLQAGTITDGTHTPKLQESSDNTTFTDVAAGDLQGSFTALTTGAGNGGSAIQEVGYIGSKRYIRVFVTVASATTGGVYGASVIRGYARHNPAGATQTP